MAKRNTDLSVCAGCLVVIAIIIAILVQIYPKGVWFTLAVFCILLIICFGSHESGPP